MIAAADETCGGVVVNQTNVTCPEVVACLPFATPAETIAGTSTTTIVNPADLYARENIPAQTGLGLVLSAIPAPTASQSNWGVNTLGETLHYMPGVGWKIVENRFGASAVQAAAIATPAGIWTTGVSLTTPRAGRVIVTSHIRVDNFIYSSWAGGLSTNGIIRTASNALEAGPSGAVSLQGGGALIHDTSSGNTTMSWTGDVTAGTVLEIQGITNNSPGRVLSGNIEYTYIN